MILAVLIAGILHPLSQYDWTHYRFCIDSLGQDEQSCCDNSGGIYLNGVCTDPPSVRFPGDH